MPTVAVPVLTRIGEGRFKRMVRPGETLRCDVTVIDRIGPARWLKARSPAAA